MAVQIEISGKGTEGLQRGDHTRLDVLAVKKLPEANCIFDSSRWGIELVLKSSDSFRELTVPTSQSEHRWHGVRRPPLARGCGLKVGHRGL